jgi:hypothetical protein
MNWPAWRRNQGYRVSAHRPILDEDATRLSAAATLDGALSVHVMFDVAGYTMGRIPQGFAVDGTAYIEVHLATEVLPHYFGIGLVSEFVQVYRRSQGIREVIYGQHTRQDESLCSFNEKSGFL